MKSFTLLLLCILLAEGFDKPSIPTEFEAHFVRNTSFPVGRFGTEYNVHLLVNKKEERSYMRIFNDESYGNYWLLSPSGSNRLLYFRQEPRLGSPEKSACHYTSSINFGSAMYIPETFPVHWSKRDSVDVSYHIACILFVI
eukprot:TRINITY_DN658_c0_g1_i2.p1 TRINITY_DN658_c0_g1~~TRINITY_DN658_c0_g1_i2.p1  ORF type:complete len:141 (+),score=12.50 TRINITY_DN658_c0_g1_i2:134-556(+)